VLPIKIGVRIDHLRFNPQAEVHAERVDLVYERFEAARKLYGVYVPVA
jgi:hypothetical protein